ncbi:pantetheine-phosphate adenylyltransferase [Candidatus Woesebacteria bacterium]|nr:pantetheine-phosphate adenylyltransferase [Candidatus Woesebacteria bacterium]
MSTRKHYAHTGLGGTFDRLHKGHEYLLKKAFEEAEHVTIGVTKESLLTEKYLAQTILPFEKRRQELKEFLASEGFVNRAQIIALEDIYGIADKDETMEALVVTDATKANGEKINAARTECSLERLDLVHVPFVKDEDGVDIISSERIRKGEIDRNGLRYMSIFEKSDVLGLPSSLREQLREPFGKLIVGDENDLSKAAKCMKKYMQNKAPVMIIAVGDIVTQTLENVNLEPQISIIDFRTQRQKIAPFDRKMRGIVNEPGQIHKKAVVKIQNSIHALLKNNEQSRIIIDGEEDLLALPAMLLAPLGSIVVYGLRQKGVVVVQIEEGFKKVIKSLVEKFDNFS